MKSARKYRKMELQNIDKHTGINTWVCRDACRLMKSIVASNWNNCHVCNADTECTYCESSVIWHQLCLQLVTYMAPENPAYPPDVSPLRQDYKTLFIGTIFLFEIEIRAELSNYVDCKVFFRQDFTLRFLFRKSWTKRRRTTDVKVPRHRERGTRSPTW